MRKREWFLGFSALLLLVLFFVVLMLDLGICLSLMLGVVAGILAIMIDRNMREEW